MPKKSDLLTSGKEDKDRKFVEKITAPDPNITPDVEVSGDEPKKRHRRTKAEIMAERGLLPPSTFDDSGYEIIADIFKWRADEDTKKFNLPACNKEDFFAISQNVMKISNYFLGRYAKPVHFLIVTTAVQSFVMLTARASLIKEYYKAPVKAKPDIAPPIPEKKGEISLTGHIPDNTKKDQ